MEFSPNVILAVVLLSFPFSYAFWKSWENFRSKQFAKKLLRQLDADLTFASDIAAEMQHLYGYTPNPNMLLLQDLLANIEAGEMVGEFEILRKIEFDDDSFLFVTMSHEKHYFTNKHGKEKFSVEHYQLSFLVKNDPEKKQTGVWSDFYESLPHKLLRQEFAQELFKRAALQ